MTNREIRRLLSAFAGYLLPRVIVVVIAKWKASSPDGHERVPNVSIPTYLWIVVVLFTGSLILALSMMIRRLLRRNYLPDGGMRAFCCGGVAVVFERVCDHLGLGFVTMISVECILVLMFPLWNGTNTPAEKYKQ